MMLPDSRADRDYYIERERRYYGSPEDVDMRYEAGGDPDRHTPAGEEYSGDFGWPCATPPPIVPQAIVMIGEPQC